MKKIFEVFYTGSIFGKFCLIGFLVPFIVGIIYFFIGKADSFNSMWLYLLCYTWFSITLLRCLFSTSCPHCKSLNNSKMGKRKIESYEGKKTQKIQVGSYMLSGGKVHDFYDVPAKITKVAFILSVIIVNACGKKYVIYKQKKCRQFGYLY